MSDPLVLVTGASGFVATYVVKTVQEAGYRVRGTVRSTKNEKRIQHLYDLCPNAKHKLELVEADLNNADSWIAAVKGCTYVLHTASPFPLANPKNEDEVIKPAVDGTVSVLKACAADGGVKRVVLTSSGIAVSYLGGYKEPKTEKDWTDLKTANAYGKSKTLAEKAAWDFIKDLPEDKKFELAVVNPVLVIGPTLHGGGGTSTEILKNVMNLPMMPKLNANVVDIRNVAEAHLKCMTLPEAAGNRHILIDNSYWMIDFARALAKEFNPQGYKISTRQLPLFVLWLGSFFSSEMAAMYAAGKDPIYMSNDRMRTVLKIEPIPMEKSFVDMTYSMIERGFLPKTAKYTGPKQ